MSSKRKLLRKIMAGIIETPAGWEHIVAAATADTASVPVLTATVPQESTAGISEMTATIDTTVVEDVPTEVPVTTVYRIADDLTEAPTSKKVSKARRPKTTTKRTSIKRKASHKAKKE
jgi:hypothetical protein|tara:strand:- start:172 stop:525 length:354 start_codon:yes stop_codon:yes gene_type:complete